MSRTADLLPGTLDLLILKAVSLRPLHGYGILLRIGQISRSALEVPQGSLYPVLYRLEHQRLIEAEWGQSDSGRKAKYYTLTSAGRRRLKEEAVSWNRCAQAIAAGTLARRGAASGAAGFRQGTVWRRSCCAPMGRSRRGRWSCWSACQG